jgi:hypothetical protein
MTFDEWAEKHAIKRGGSRNFPIGYFEAAKAGWAAGAAAERERCAEVCQALMYRSDKLHTPEDCAASIRGMKP